MVEKISVQIALEGGAEVARQLEGIGEAGQKAFEDISKSAEQVGGFKNLKPEEVTGKLKQLGIEGTDAFDKIQQAVKSAAKFETLVQGVQSVETALTALGQAAGPVGAAIVAGFVAIGKAAVGLSEEISKISEQAAKTGASFEQFRQMQKELEKIGLSAKEAGNGLEHFQKQLGEPTSIAFNVLTQTGNALRFVGEEGNKAANELPRLMETLRQMPDGLERTNLAIKNFGEAAGTAIIQGLRRAEGSMSEVEAKAYDVQQALKSMSTEWDNFKAEVVAPIAIPFLTEGIAVAKAFASTFSDIGNIIASVVSALGSLGTDKWNLLSSAVQGAASAIGDFVSSLAGISWDAISSAGVAAWNAVTDAVLQAGQTISTFASSLFGITWDAISGAGVAAWQALSAAISEAINKLMQFIGIRPSTPSGAPGVGGMAGGGIIGGRGTGTSDSNLAWVSRGEHIMPARAVAQPGVLAFLEALRRSGGNLRGVLDGMGRFALGGLVPRPAFAAGGLVGSMSNVTINFPGTPPISGLRASTQVVDQLQKAAALAQVRSGGRKPSRYS